MKVIARKRAPISPGQEQDVKCLSTSLEDNITIFKHIFAGDEMFIARKFQNKYLPEAKCCILYLEQMVDVNILNNNIILPIMRNDLTERIDIHHLLTELQQKVVISSNVSISADIDGMVRSINIGYTALLLEGYNQALIIGSKGWQTRAITEPESIKAIRGPREGFTESLDINLSLIRRKINNADLKFIFKELGVRTHTRTCICYIEGLTLDKVIQELQYRLSQITLDGIMDSGYIQELIRDAPFSPFDMVGSTEKPDIVAAKMLEGRVALFVEGSPFVLTVPYVMAESVQSSEDYYNNYIFASINRLFRSFSIFASTCVPALYLAITTYHQEMIPTPLLLSFSASRQGVPFPTSLSLFIMLFVFDILREAGIRMPAPIGQAINIVGTLVLGQAAVEAKLVSAPVIIVTAFSGITTLMNPTQTGPTIIIRTALLLGASVLGIYGLIFVSILVVLHLMNLRSFGIPYMLNLTSAANYDGQDIWVRAPWWSMKLRPKLIGARNFFRQSPTGSRVK